MSTKLTPNPLLSTPVGDEFARARKLRRHRALFDVQIDARPLWKRALDKRQPGERVRQ